MGCLLVRFDIKSSPLYIPVSKKGYSMSCEVNSGLVNGSKILSTPFQNGHAGNGSSSSSVNAPFSNYSDEDRLLNQLFEKRVVDRSALCSHNPSTLPPLPREMAPALFGLLGEFLPFKTKEGKPFYFCVNAFLAGINALGCWTALVGDGVFAYLDQNFISQVFDQLASGLSQIPVHGQGKKCTLYVHFMGLNVDGAANIKDLLIKMIVQSRFEGNIPSDPSAYLNMYSEVERTAFTQLRSDFSNGNQYLQFAIGDDFILEMVLGQSAQPYFFMHDSLLLKFNHYPTSPYFYQAFIDRSAKIIHAVEWKLMNPKMLATLYCLQAGSYRNYSKDLEKNLIDKLFPEAKAKWFAGLLKSTLTHDISVLPLAAARACHSLLTHGREKLALEVWKEMLPETPAKPTGFFSLSPPRTI